MGAYEIQNKINKLASEIIMADKDYVYDPKHVKRPHGEGTWYKTEKGWTTHKPLRDPHKKPPREEYEDPIEKSINNPKATPEELHDALSFMEDHESYDQYHRVLQNKNVSSKDVDWVAEKYIEHDSDIDERENMEYLKNNAISVINHPNVTERTLQKLTQVHDKEVATEAKRALKSKNFPSQKSDLSNYKSKKSSELAQMAKKGDLNARKAIENRAAERREYCEDHIGDSETYQQMKSYKKAIGEKKGWGRSPEEVKRDFINGMDPSKYDSPQAFENARKRIEQMPVKDFDGLLGIIFSKDEDEILEGDNE